MLAGVAALLPLTAFDSDPFEILPDEDAVVAFAISLSALITGLRADLQSSVDAAQEQLDAHDAAAAPRHGWRR